jgi:hypothetical protein
MMFRSTTPVAEPAHGVVVPEGDVIALSVLQLDLPQPPEGWPAFLGRRGVAIVPDSLGRDAIGHDAARRLLDERRADELRRARRLAVAEAEAVEADRVKFAQIWRGVSADAIPVGVQPATAMLQAAKDAQPKRSTPLEEAFSNSPGMAYHQFSADEE